MLVKVSSLKRTNDQTSMEFMLTVMDNVKMPIHSFTLKRVSWVYVGRRAIDQRQWNDQVEKKRR